MAAESAAGFGFDLRTLAMVSAWGDASFKATLQADPDTAMQQLCDAFGIPKPSVRWKVVDEADGEYTIVLPANPLGVPPAERTDDDMTTQGKTGFVCSYTSECGCGDSYTGGCPCGHTVSGSPCVGCQISRSVCPGG